MFRPITFNPCSGTLVKSHSKSYFMLGHIDSKNTDSLMGKNYSKIILQVMIISDNYLLYEIIDGKDFNAEE